MKWGTILILACLAVTVFNGWQVAQLNKRHLVVLNEYFMQGDSTSWQSGKTKHTVTTPKLAEETLSEWIKRHREALDVAQTIWPPD